MFRLPINKARNIPRVQAVDGTPSFALHFFSILTLIMLFLFKDSANSLIYFLVPALLISFPIFLYSHDPVNTFLLSQYIVISSFALSQILTPAQVGRSLVITILIINIVKLRSISILPPLGPVFFYVCISSFALNAIYKTTDAKEFFYVSNAYPLWCLLSLFLTIKSKLLITPLLPSLGLLYLIWQSPNDRGLYFILSTLFLMLVVYACRYFRVHLPVFNSRVTILEEFFLLIVAALIINRILTIDYETIYLSLFIIYGAVSIIFFYLRNNHVPIISASASIFSLFLFFNVTDLFNSYSYHASITSLAIASILGVITIISRHYYIAHTDDLSKFLLALQLLIIFRKTSFKIGEVFPSTLAVIVGSVIFMMVLAITHYSRSYTYENMLNGLISLRDLVVIRRWIRSVSLFAASLPMVGPIFNGINFLLFRLREAFHAQHWNLNHILVIGVCFLSMLFITKWGWLVFRSWPMLEQGKIIIVDEYLKENSLSKVYKIAFDLSAFAIFGSILGMIGAKSRFEYLRLLAVLVPFAGIIWYYISNESKPVPWPLFFLGLSLLYLGLRFSTGYFIDKPGMGLTRMKSPTLPLNSESKELSFDLEKITVSFDNRTRQWTAESGPHKARARTPQIALQILLTRTKFSQS